MSELTAVEIFGGLLLAAFTGVTGWFASIRKAKSDETQLALDAWKDLIDPLKHELKEARLEIASLRRHIDEIERGHKEERAHLLEQINKLKKTK